MEHKNLHNAYRFDRLRADRMHRGAGSARHHSDCAAVYEEEVGLGPHHDGLHVILCLSYLSVLVFVWSFIYIV